MAAARYANGHTAEIEIVSLAFPEDGLLAQTRSGAILWPWADVVRIDDGVGPVILRLRIDDGQRLTLDDVAAQSLRAARPAVLSRSGARAQAFGLAIGLTIAAVGLVAAVFVGWPLAVGPLARALPDQADAIIGDIAWAQVQALAFECYNDPDLAGVDALEDLAWRLADAAGGGREVSVFVVDADFANAFALPGGRIVFTDDLIALAGHPDELAGVMAHELAHVRERHALEAILRNAGIGVMADIVLGGGGVGQALAGATMNVAALRYDRDVEREADRLGQQYLRDAGLDPGGMAAFFDRIAEIEPGVVQALPELLSTHPDSRRRAEEARANALPGRPPALSKAEWVAVRSVCGMSPLASKPLE